MSFFTMIFIVSILGAIMGVNKPWMGGIPGLLITPFLFSLSISFNIFTLIISVLFFLTIGFAYGFVSSIIFSGLNGRSHCVGQAFTSGFGAHHPGGIILSDEEQRMLKAQNIWGEMTVSY